MDPEMVLAKPGHTRFFWVAFTALMTVSGFLIVSSFIGGLGFPLDDAWIHQTYARNLAQRGEWSFIPGVLSGGSTAPLWTILLSIAHVLGLPPVVWSTLLGFLTLVMLAIVGEQIFRHSLELWHSQIPWMGILLASEWHLIWAALSGMETLLYALMIILVFHVLFMQKQLWITGLLLGIIVWIRPDGLTLLGPIFFVVLLGTAAWRKKLTLILEISGVFLLGFLPYLVFNRFFSGAWMPTTFYAKQAEYAVLVQTPFFERLGSLFLLPLIGVGVLLLPGFLQTIVLSFHKKQWVGIAAILWWSGYNLIYAVSLPVTYQHGRYLIPTMPVYFVLAGIGTASLMNWLKVQSKPITRVVRAAWLLTITLVLFAFSGLGAVSYAEDTAIIETEMVAAARWVAENTPAESLIAAHDIGALGYFGQRDLLDMAGLITPEVIPFIRDEQKLAEFLTARGAEYLVTFPGWYPEITRPLTPVYSSAGQFSPRAGGENMAIYRWR